MAVVAEADKLRAQGIDVVDFGAGEPHFATPQHIKDAAIAAIQGNFTKYTAVPGTPELRDAIVHRHAVDFDSDYRREEVIASTGGKNALFNAIQVLVDHGDEVILPVPYWVSFKDIVRYAGGQNVLLETDESQGFRVTAEMIARLITSRTKVIILNSPSNPSGAVMSADDLTAVVRLAHERGIWVLSDECYVYLNYTGRNFSVGSLRLRYDWMETRLCAWSCGGGERNVEVAEPIHFESHFDCAEGSGGGIEWTSGVRRANAAGIHPAARSRRERLAVDS
jgi:aspartate aminotransferase